MAGNAGGGSVVDPIALDEGEAAAITGLVSGPLVLEAVVLAAV